MIKMKNILTETTHFEKYKNDDSIYFHYSKYPNGVFINERSRVYDTPIGIYTHKATDVESDNLYMSDMKYLYVLKSKVSVVDFTDLKLTKPIVKTIYEIFKTSITKVEGYKKSVVQLVADYNDIEDEEMADFIKHPDFKKSIIEYIQFMMSWDMQDYVGEPDQFFSEYEDSYNAFLSVMADDFEIFYKALNSDDDSDIWWFVANVALYICANKKEPKRFNMLWNRMLRQIGIQAVRDTNYMIHDTIKKQTVFLSNDYFEIVDRIEQTDIKKTDIDNWD